jgi:signal transduction histidine kinase
VKFTERGEVTLLIRRERGQASVFCFDVLDTGPGIPQDRMEEIFQPFRQVGLSTSQTEGTGLGLAISRKLARLMGGDIVAQSEVGRGSVFTFSIELPEISGMLADKMKQRQIGQHSPEHERPPMIERDSGDVRSQRG